MNWLHLSVYISSCLIIIRMSFFYQLKTWWFLFRTTSHLSRSFWMTGTSEKCLMSQEKWCQISIPLQNTLSQLVCFNVVWLRLADSAPEATNNQYGCFGHSGMRRTSSHIQVQLVEVWAHGSLSIRSTAEFWRLSVVPMAVWVPELSSWRMGSAPELGRCGNCHWLWNVVSKCSGTLKLWVWLTEHVLILVGILHHNMIPSQHEKSWSHFNNFTTTLSSLQLLLQPLINKSATRQNNSQHWLKD